MKAEEYLNNGFPTYAQFQNDLKLWFKPVLLKEKVRTKLDHIKQETYTVDEYNAEFDVLLHYANLKDENEKIRKYKRSLNRLIREKTLTIDRGARLITYNDWKLQAAEFDNNWRAAQEEYKTEASAQRRTLNTTS